MKRDSICHQAELRDYRTCVFKVELRPLSEICGRQDLTTSLVHIDTVDSMGDSGSCSGTLINDNAVLTTMDCLVDNYGYEGSVTQLMFGCTNSSSDDCVVRTSGMYVVEVPTYHKETCPECDDTCYDDDGKYCSYFGLDKSVDIINSNL